MVVRFLTHHSHYLQCSLSFSTRAGELPKTNHQKIQNLKKSLKDLLEPNYGLLDHLLSLGVLSRSEIADVRSRILIAKQNACLLDILALKTEEHCLNFLAALERTNQMHIVNYIHCNGGRLYR